GRAMANNEARHSPGGPLMAHELAPALTDADLWEEGLWNELLAYLEDGRVIPILGPDLLTIEVQGRRMLLDRYLALELAGGLALRREELSADPTLAEVVCHFLHLKGPRSLYLSIYDIMQKASFDPPGPLLQLARIPRFNLFVTTTFDPLLEKALRA